jgi:hypothetical protein
MDIANSPQQKISFYPFITRTIDALIVAYDEQAFPCFLGDLKDTMDAVSNTQ